MATEEKDVQAVEPAVSEKSDNTSEKASETTSTPASFDKHAERKLLWKLDLRLMPILLLLFLVSFVDRTNIGNAKIQGLEKSLHMKGNQFNIALFVFNIPYVLLDIPSNLIMLKVKPGYWLGGSMFCWGLATIGQGLTKNFAGLVACRVLMGIFEAGFVPGCALLIGSYYKRHEFQVRYSLFFSAAILAGAFGGLLAYLLVKLDGRGGYEGWRWIFLIEGILTCGFSLIATFIVCPWPKDCNFLSPDEKTLLLDRLAADSGPSRIEHWNWSTVKSVITDWKIWVAMFAYFGADNTAGSIASFQPVILTGLGYQAADAQVHTIPVYMVALVCSLTAAWLSDRYRQRYIVCMVGVSMAVIGWSIELAQAGTPGVRYFGLFMSLSGTYILMPVLIVWLMNNMGGTAKRSFATAFQIGCGNTAAFVSSNSFKNSESPTYPTGFGCGLGLQIFAGIMCTIMWFFLRRENKRRDAGGRDDRLNYTEEELADLGDQHPAFRYTL